MRFVRALLLGAVAVSPMHTAVAQEAERKPEFMRSLADPADVKGPLFVGLAKNLAAVGKGDDAAWNASLLPKADVRLYSSSDGKPQPHALTADMIRAMAASCFGPYLVDEGKDWTQFSWVCDPKGATPLSKYVKFRESPELAATVFFVQGKVERMMVVEPLPFPGGRLLTMDAYDVLKADRK